MLVRHRTWAAGLSAPGDDTNDSTVMMLESCLWELTVNARMHFGI
jgi:hypothetical protein